MTMPSHPTSPNRRARLVPLAVMMLTPLFFSSNLIFGRSTIPEVAPFTLAFLRWTAASLAACTVRVDGARPGSNLREQPSCALAAFGFLGHVDLRRGRLLCTAIHHRDQRHTDLHNLTADDHHPRTPVFRSRRRAGVNWPASWSVSSGWRSSCSRAMSQRLARSFNRGDLMFIAAALSWAGYSVLLKGRRTAGLPVSALFAVVAHSGALLLAPFALWEFLAAAMMPQTGSAWGGIAGIVVFSSLLGLRRLSVRGRPAWGLDRKRLHVSPAPLWRRACGACSRRAVSELPRHRHLHRADRTGPCDSARSQARSTQMPGLADPAKRGKRLEQPVGHRRHSAGQEQDPGEHQQCAGDLLDGAQMPGGTFARTA
jgi:hypothetical protein